MQLSTSEEEPGWHRWSNSPPRLNFRSTPENCYWSQTPSGSASRCQPTRPVAVETLWWGYACRRTARTTGSWSAAGNRVPSTGNTSRNTGLSLPSGWPSWRCPIEKRSRPFALSEPARRLVDYLVFFWGGNEYFRKPNKIENLFILLCFGDLYCLKCYLGREKTLYLSNTSV